MFKTIGHWLAHHRSLAGCSQSRLGDLVGVGQSAVGNWEAGRRNIGRLEMVAICEALDIPEKDWPEAMRLPVQVDEDEAQLEGAA